MSDEGTFLPQIECEIGIGDLSCHILSYSYSRNLRLNQHLDRSSRFSLFTLLSRPILCIILFMKLSAHVPFRRRVAYILACLREKWRSQQALVGWGVLPVCLFARTSTSSNQSHRWVRRSIDSVVVGSWGFLLPCITISIVNEIRTGSSLPLPALRRSRWGFVQVHKCRIYLAL